MTEHEWLECTDPRRMIQRLRARAVPRKLQLLICACFRQAGVACRDEQCQKAVEMSEEFVEGAVSEAELAVAWKSTSLPARLEAHRMAWDITRMNRWLAPLVAWRVRHLRGAAADEEMLPQCHLLRDIFGNPFRPVIINPAWLTWNESTVRRLAQAIYDEGAFDRMPILADALEDAGCDNADILNHCRSDGPHVRGCWVVDLLLSKQ